MTKAAPLDEASLAKFNAEYDVSHEATALRMRGVFIREFPLISLNSLTLDDYVIGRHRRTSFCYLVEAGSKAWANIQGATSRKFGVYFGRTKSDPTQKYRFADRFGTNENEAFAAVKSALLDLVALGVEERPDFRAIDANPLSQMFKAKILSLYYPDRFLAVCSSEHLEMLGGVLGFQSGLPSSQYQNLLLKAKHDNPTTRQWSAPKFMAYLYKVHVRANRAIESPIEKPRANKHRRVNFEEIQKQREEIGRVAEAYALEWEKERLVTDGPYRFVRHPGYLAMLFIVPFTALTLGSTIALIPASIYGAIILVRTTREDRFLICNLTGYAHYAEKVRYRLIPHFW
jgi:hypothetical protein